MAVEPLSCPREQVIDTPTRSKFALGKWAVLVLLVLTTAANHVDRQLPFIMAEPIKVEFKLTDTQLGMLGGIGFSLIYAIAALPLARLADRHSRRMVLAGSIAVWSLCTAAGGLAATYLHLLVSRAGVAVGEAGAAPATHSLVADMFPASQRGFALALNSAGISLGVLIGMAVGGFLLEYMHWRSLLMLAALPGAVLALVFIIFVREPPRHGACESKPPSFRPACAKLWQQRSFVWMVTGCMLCTFAASGSAAFGASYFIRVHGSSLAAAGLAVGVAIGLGSTVGGVLTGVVADRLNHRDRRWVLWLAAIGMLLRTPFYITAWFASDMTTALVMLICSGFLGGGYLPMTYAATQAIAESRMRAFSSAVTQLVVNLLGNVAGPIAVGFLSDALAPRYGSMSIAYALAITGGASLLGAVSYWRASCLHENDIARHQLISTIY